MFSQNTLTQAHVVWADPQRDWGLYFQGLASDRNMKIVEEVQKTDQITVTEINHLTCCVKYVAMVSGEFYDRSPR